MPTHSGITRILPGRSQSEEGRKGQTPLHRKKRRYRKIHVILTILVMLLSGTACSREAIARPLTAPPTSQTPTAHLQADPPNPPSGGSPSGQLTQLPSTETANPPTPVPASRDPTPDLAHRTQYTLTADLDYGRKHVTVSQTVAYVNQSSSRLDELLLIVESNRLPGVFLLNTLSLENGAALGGYQLEGIELRVPLEPPLDPGARVELFLTYELKLPDRSGAFGYTATQVNLGDWYASAPPYVPGVGWLVHRPWSHGEHLVYGLADYAVNFRLVGETEQYGRPLVVAASTLPELDGEWRRYRFQSARSFALSVSPFFERTEVQVGDWLVESYYFSEHRPGGEAGARVVADALGYFSEIFGPYRHPSLSLVEASFGDGMEYEGLVFVSQGFYHSYDGTPNNYLTLLAAHETAHQWWYGQVGNDQALEPWLDEALATFSEILYYERFHPESLDWWWLFRVQVYGPQGRMNGSIYDYPAFRPYVNAVYLRGAQFIDDLRIQIGEQALLEFMNDYAHRFQGRYASGEEFFSLLAVHTQADISELRGRYFDSD